MPIGGTPIKKLVESEGALPAAQKIARLIDNDDKRRIRIEDVSFRECFETFVGPVSEHFPDSRNRGFHVEPLRESTTSLAFSVVTGTVISRAVQDAYASQPMILDKLVNVVRSNMRTERTAGFQAFAGINEVPEGQEYPETTFVDRGVESPEPPKRGAMIEITEETVIFDQTSQILNRARGLGMRLAMDREAYGLRTIQDLTGYKGFYPLVNGVPTQTDLFRATAGGTAWYNKSINTTGANALVDWTDINVAWQFWQDVAKIADENGDPILINPTVLLVPYALLPTALRILGAFEQRLSSASAAEWTITGNMVSAMGLNLAVLTSPYMNDSTTWYIGDFKSQYQERVIFPIQTLPIQVNGRRDIVASFRVRRKSQIETLDDKFVIKCPAT